MNMLTPLKSNLRNIAFAALGLLIGIFGIVAYSNPTAIKSAWLNFSSIAFGDKPNLKVAYACGIDEKSESEQIFFISCGGIY